MDNHHLRNSEEHLRQEAELRAIGRTFQDVEHRKRWISKVFKNLKIDGIRKNQRRAQILLREGSVFTRNRNLLSQAERVHKVINQMPEHFALILRLKIEKISYKDIAKILWDDSSDAARVRLRRLREQQAYTLFRDLWNDQV